MALNTSHCEQHIMGCFNVTKPPHILMGLINEDPFYHVKCVPGGPLHTVYVVKRLGLVQGH